MAKDDDPHRIARLARIRFHAENLQAREVMVFADELDMHLLPKVGAAWMPTGSQGEVMTQGLVTLDLETQTIIDLETLCDCKTV